MLLNKVSNIPVVEICSIYDMIIMYSGFEVNMAEDEQNVDDNIASWIIVNK